MVENSNINEIQDNIKELESDFNNLIINNPSLLYLSSKGHKPIKMISRSTFMVICISMLIGFGVALTMFYNISEQSNSTYILTQLIIGIIFPTFLFLLGKESTKLLNLIMAIVIIIITAVMGMYFQEKYKDNFHKVLPFVNFGVLIIIYIILFSTICYSKQLKDTICNRIEALKLQLSKINENQVQNSHSRIEKEIESLKLTIINNSPHPNCNDLLNKQALNLLELIRLELITHSRNGINLIENWEYIDLSQNMIDKIMNKNDNCKHITIVGELKFLSTEAGLKMLVESILNYQRTFDIYFTGETVAGTNDVIESRECETLAKIFNKKYAKHNQYNVIKGSIELIPMTSKTFTGIGFIGVANENKNYSQIYSYISSLINTTSNNIIKDNPFVFSWSEGNGNNTYFKDFVHSLLKNAKIRINGKDVESRDLLDRDKFNEIFNCKPRRKK